MFGLKLLEIFLVINECGLATIAGPINPKHPNLCPFPCGFVNFRTTILHTFAEEIDRIFSIRIICIDSDNLPELAPPSGEAQAGTVSLAAHAFDPVTYLNVFHATFLQLFFERLF